MKGDKKGHNHVTTQEFAYWLVLAEWNYFEPTGNKKQGLTGNDEFKLGLPEEIASELPLGHQLYKDYVEKILSIPDKDLIVSLFLR